jgi:phage-related protein
MARPLRPLLWMASGKRDFREFPAQVHDDLGFQLYLAQTGQHPPSAKPLNGLGSGTVELVDDFDGDTYRAIMFCTPSRRNRSGASRLRNPTLTW